MENLIAFKRHLERFVRISDDEFSRVLEFFTEKNFRKGELLVREGAAVINTYWVKRGLLVSVFTDDEGREHVIQFANENCWITDQNAFYNRDKAVFTITCLEKCDLLTLSFEKREEMCAEMPVMNHFFRKKANDSFVKQQKRLLTYMTADAKTRFRLLINEYPDLSQRVPKKTLAAYLGVSRETLSRL